MTDKQVLVPSDDHPITITPTAGHVIVTVGDTIVAESDEALTLLEGLYKPVQYVPLVDVDPDALARTDHTTYCPYKGDASYYSLVVDGVTADNAVWTYEAPYDAVREIAGHVAFYPDRARVEVV